MLFSVYDINRKFYLPAIELNSNFGLSSGSIIHKSDGSSVRVNRVDYFPKYTLAEMQFKKNDLVKCDEEIKALLQLKPSYDYWIAKALILQSKVHIAKKDFFQAEYSIKSVIDHYVVQDDGIISESNQLFDEIMQLKNQPKQVNETPTTIIEIKENEKK